ncbi:MAG: amino acid ABC transporter permease [Alphaproteobacteria bacterium]
MNEPVQRYAPGQHPDLPPPATMVGALGWLRKNLFASWRDSVLTVACIALLVWLIPPVVNWAFIDAIWTAANRDDCVKSADAACWGFVGKRFQQFMYGLYPLEERWRVDLAAAILILGVVPLFFSRFKGRKWFALFVLVLYPFVAFFLLQGGWLGLRIVETQLWGGLMVTMVIAIVGCVGSLPFGILLALGRRSRMPVVRTFCIVFIEVWRGVPLITVLFMASVMLPLFLPEGVNFNDLLRALVGVTIFASAYMAEVVRGGLQAIPKGQFEAADAMGLSYWKAHRLIILPQALKIVIPGIVNQFVALLKDTSLVAIVGLFDFFGIIDSATKDPNWLSRNVPYTGYVFAAAVYWALCFGISRYGMRLEKRLNTGHRRK